MYKVSPDDVKLHGAKTFAIYALSYVPGIFCQYDPTFGTDLTNTRESKTIKVVGTFFKALNN